MADIDWAALQKEAADTVLTDGDYVVIVTAATATTSSNGKPMIKLTFTVAEGPKQDRKLFTQFVLSVESPFALQRWFANLAAFGLEQTWLVGAKPDMDTIAAVLLNRGAIATVGQREWQGSMRNEVTGMKPYVPNGPTPPGMILGAPTVTGPGGPSAPRTPSSPPSVAASPTAGPTPPSAPSRPF